MNVQSEVSDQATRRLAERASAVRFDDLPDDIIELSVHCLLDYFAVALSGSRSEPVRLLLQAALEESDGGVATIIGHDASTSPFWASWVNGAAAHVDVYDDVNMTIPGHGSATTLPAVIALAEATGASGRQVIEAFVAGYETTCAIGAAISPSHYEMGYHASSTIGSFGAAAAAGRLHGLSGAEIAEAFGIASTMAGGLKGVFGTMTKCVQVGRAPATGVIAASLARRGVASGGTIFEHPQGFVAVYSKASPAAVDFSTVPGSFALRDNLFKYYAACYMANAPIECASAIRDRLGPRVEDICKVTVTVSPAAGDVCNIQRPTTSLEVKYSARAVVAMALKGISPALMENFESVAGNYDQIASLADLTDVRFDGKLTETQCAMAVVLRDGSNIRHHHDAGVAETDLSRQGARLSKKFVAFVEPVLGSAQTQELRHAILNLPSQPSLERLLKIAGRSPCVPAPTSRRPPIG